MAGNTVVDAINSIATNARVRLAMLMGARLESGWNPGASGDGGTSFGAYQIHLPAHPGVTEAQAKDPAFATRYMLKAYEAGVNRVDPALWNSNPAVAAATAAFYAERPKVMYPTDRINAAWTPVNGAWSGGSGGTGGTGVDSLTGKTGGIPSLGDMWDTIWESISWFLWDTFGSLVDYMYFAALYGIGGVTVAVGFYLLFKESRAAPASAKVVSGYRTVLGKA